MFVKGSDAKARRSFARSANIGVRVSALRLRHVTHLVWIVLNAVLSLTMENFCSIKALKYFTPWCQCLCCFRNNRTAACQLSSKIMCLMSKLATSRCFVWPWERRRLLAPMNGEKSCIIEVLISGQHLDRFFASFGNDSGCTKRKNYFSELSSSTKSVIAPVIVLLPEEFSDIRKI